MGLRETEPPRLLLRFFRWYCHPDMADYIEGDLLEVYQRRLRASGRRVADWKFFLDVLLLFRPGIIRPRKPYQNLNSYGMYKSYFKIGWRSLLRNKEYSLINMAGLALSITCCIVIFSLVRHHLRFDDFHGDPDRIYRVVTEMHREDVSFSNSVPSPLGRVFRENHTEAELVARMYNETEAVITFERDGEKTLFKEPEGFAFTEPEFFDIFNFPMEKGASSQALNEPNKALITQRIASKYFGEKDPLGQVIYYDSKIPFTVVGVLQDLPANSDFRMEIFVSYATLKDFNPWLGSDNAWGGISSNMFCFTKLKPGVDSKEVEAILQPYVSQYRPNSKNVHHYKLQPLEEMHFDGRYGGAMEKSDLWILAAIGIFLLITASVNFVNLATAQALKRSREVGVRKALGSFRSQLFWQFILETGIITFVSVGIALLVAYLLIPSVNAFYGIQLPTNLFADPLVLLFSLGLGLLVTFLAGFYPALILTGFTPVVALKGKITQFELGGFNTRRSLIIAQFAISQVLIIGVVVIMNQMSFARKAEMGFDRESIVMVKMGNDSISSRKALKSELLRLPGVEKISLCYAAPASEADWGNTIKFDTDTEEVNFRTNMKLADEDYISTFGLELVAGRNLNPADTVREVIVNEALLQRLGFTTYEEALGKMVYANGGTMNGAIVGVVRDFHDKSFHQEISPAIIATASSMYSNFAIKINGNSTKATLEEIEKLWKEQTPDQLFEYFFVDEDIAKFYKAEENVLKGIQLSSMIAIFIGCLGLYGLVSFMVAQKTKEIGIRKVLGGGTSQIVWIFGQEFVRLVLIAFLIAGPIGWYLMGNWLEDFQFKISLEPWFFLITVIFSFLIVGVTVGYQVMRAALLKPAISLKTE